MVEQAVSGMQAIVGALSLEQLNTLKAQSAGNISLVTLIDGVLEARKAEQANIKLEEIFKAKLVKLASLPQPPSTIHNVYLAWAQVEEPTGEPDVMVDVVKTPAVYKANDKGEQVLVTASVMAKEARTPKHLIWKWIVETNKGFMPSKTDKSSNQASVTTKRAITVKRVTGTTVEIIGNFSSGSKACEHLKINPNKGSANLALRNSGYIVESYEGTDLIS
jgi:hypothetical protein